MYFSHIFLARKSPLGTVWIAAHLERKIKKPQIDGVDIPSYADCIMFPDVPIALRLSGHLLLGLVRIYSWKVNYLFQDCNRMLTDIRTVFTSVQIDLPIDADRAPFESVTWPETFDLDAMKIDESCLISSPDTHRKTYDEITIEDQIPHEAEQYVSIVIDKDDRITASPIPENLNPSSVMVEEDVSPPFDGTPDDLVTPPGNVPDVRDPGPSYQAETSVQNFNEGPFSHDLPVFEAMCDAVPDFVEQSPSTNVPDFVEELQEQSTPSTNRKEILSSIMEGLSVSGCASSFMPAHDKAQMVASADAIAILNSATSSGQKIPDVELQPSLPIKQQKARKKKRNAYNIENIVLTNAEMKKQLEDTSKLVCKRRKLPDTVLDLWRYRRTSDCIFIEPSISGMCANLQGVYKRTFPSSRSEFTSLDSPGPSNVPEMEPAIPDTEMRPASPATEMGPAIPDTEMRPASPATEAEPATHVTEIETEHPRFGGNGDFHSGLMPSPSRAGEFTPLDSNNLGSVSDKGKTFETEVLATYEIPASEKVGRELKTPVNWEELLRLDDTNPRELPSLLNSADVEELNFLEASNASSGYDTIEVENMSVRTRAVAQYLKEHSPTSQALEEQAGSLSLNRILEKKTRKQCARMFFETLVLKSYGLIDVQQEKAYEDILISPTPALSSAKF